MVWSWSTAVAYAYYVLPVFKAWRRNPEDRQIIELRNWCMERFDQGVIYEHTAFPVILITGPLLYFVGPWSIASNWLLLKILIVLMVAIPIEICDYYLSHFGGNKERVRASGDAAGYEMAVQRHWLFFLLSMPPIMIAALLIAFLAIAKPF